MVFDGSNCDYTTSTMHYYFADRVWTSEDVLMTTVQTSSLIVVHVATSSSWMFDQTLQEALLCIH